MADHRASWNEVYSEHNRITVNTVLVVHTIGRQTDSIGFCLHNPVIAQGGLL